MRRNQMRAIVMHRVPRARPLTRLCACQSGATAIEYGLLAAMISIFILSMVTTSGAVSAIYDSLTSIVSAMTAAG